MLCMHQDITTLGTLFIIQAEPHALGKFYVLNHQSLSYPLSLFWVLYL